MLRASGGEAGPKRFGAAPSSRLATSSLPSPLHRPPGGRPLLSVRAPASRAGPGRGLPGAPRLPPSIRGLWPRPGRAYSWSPRTGRRTRRYASSNSEIRWFCLLNHQTKPEYSKNFSAQLEFKALICWFSSTRLLAFLISIRCIFLRWTLGNVPKLWVSPWVTQTASKCHWYLEQITSHLSPVWYLPVKPESLLQTCCATISFRCLLLSFHLVFGNPWGRRVPAFSVSLFPRAELSGQWALTDPGGGSLGPRASGVGEERCPPQSTYHCPVLWVLFPFTSLGFLFRQETRKKYKL